MSYLYRLIFSEAEANDWHRSILFTSKKKADKCAAGMTGGWQRFIRIEKIEKPTTTKGWVELANKMS